MLHASFAVSMLTIFFEHERTDLLHGGVVVNVTSDGHIHLKNVIYLFCYTNWQLMLPMFYLIKIRDRGGGGVS